MFRASIHLPASLTQIQAATLSEAASDLCVSACALRHENHENSPWVLEWLSEKEPDCAVLKARMEISAELHEIPLPDDLNIEQELLPERDWLEYSYQQFPPFTVGPFFIHGSHYEDGVPEGLMGLQIDAATAFGSGEHGTTRGCLEAMIDLKGQGACPWNVLDMGTGSGILAIAAWKLWKTPVLAVDNDAESIRVFERHVEANNVPGGKGNVRGFVNNGFEGDEVSKRGPFDLIIANILPGPLKEMAKDLAATNDENGHVILSGILNEQADDVILVYKLLGLDLKKHIEIGEWSTLLLQKSSA